MLGLLGGGDLDEASWEEVEDTLLIADLGPVVTSVVEQLRSRLAASPVRTEADARAVLREVLIAELNPGLDRSIKALPHADKPSVLLVVGVNSTGKTTTVGKLARVLVADGRRVVLGAAGYLPRRRRRPAAELGVAGRCRGGPRRRGRRPGVGGLRRWSTRELPPERTSSSSTLPDGCTPRPA